MISLEHQFLMSYFTALLRFFKIFFNNHEFEKAIFLSLNYSSHSLNAIFFVCFPSFEKININWVGQSCRRFKKNICLGIINGELVNSISTLKFDVLA